MPSQQGRLHVITGANVGLGLASTRALVARGAHVVMACRDVARAEAEAAALRLARPGAAIEVEPCDLAALASVRACAARILARHPRIDGLLLDAGLMAAAGARTADGFDMTFGVCHLGHFALTGALMPALRDARVVSVSSLYHHIGRYRAGDDPAHPAQRDRGRSYADAKLANLLFTFELDRRAKAAGLGLVAAAAHPGYSRTEFQPRSVKASGTRFPVRGMLSTLGLAVFGQSVERGVLPQLRAATDPDVRGGDYFGPDGFREITGRGAAPARVARAARDPERARALWELSVRLTGTPFPGM
jgi:NAD(P)-dependent dehydrogenase (short-subunit alcohol dehydrogenase family)